MVKERLSELSRSLSVGSLFDRSYDRKFVSDTVRVNLRQRDRRLL